MGGTLRSKGCSVCVKRKVKCDETRPKCLRCQKRNVDCPGYERQRKFHLVCPGELEPENLVKNGSPVGQQVSSNTVLLRATPARRGVGFMSIDETVNSSLVARTVDSQLREAFCAFVPTAFPGQYNAYVSRLNMTWVSFARSQKAPNPTLDWSLRGIAMLYMGKIKHDQRLVYLSRDMYRRALRHLARVIGNPSMVASDDALASTMFLATYELMADRKQKSWILHSRGLSHLIRLRRPQAYVDGTARLLLVSFRPFFVFQAFLLGERCFLEDPVWKSGIDEALALEEQRGKASRLGALVEHAFYEIARCPGFLVSTKTLIASSQKTFNHRRKDLTKDIANCRDALCGMRSQLKFGLNAASDESHKYKLLEFVGPIPASAACLLANSSLEGICTAIAMLQQLIAVISSEATRRAALLSSRIPAVGPDVWHSAAMALKARALYSQHLLWYESSDERTENLMDRIAMSLGMLTLRTQAE
ncbi:hypothetical protein P168DRAFT_126421 [Aspergillus campestris IBT 28561]|uniref:Zn(2)-C6 fungal-type domain-containing protein n=1 Tax=Aspergillus campestris (strain IBT 28561) TaxID=1392248 RepID=A0A2I1D6P4_ASPC2|nr:uncharacterized protein P168DRAFT_126421 [Aspergillus campestris IBT 28561]PKY05552.1 hypothetical protein P168DRAFT_126421 [Aspergillus campestris IBT 28561]